MVEIKIWHDIYKSLPDDGERVIVNYQGKEEFAVWYRKDTLFRFVSISGNDMYTTHYLNPFKTNERLMWRREIFSSFNGNIKEGDDVMNKRTMSFLRKVAMTGLGIALGGSIFGLPGALAVSLALIWKN